MQKYKKKATSILFLFLYLYVFHEKISRHLLCSEYKHTDVHCENCVVGKEEVRECETGWKTSEITQENWYDRKKIAIKWKGVRSLKIDLLISW